MDEFIFIRTGQAGIVMRKNVWAMVDKDHVKEFGRRIIGVKIKKFFLASMYAPYEANADDERLNVLADYDDDREVMMRYCRRHELKLVAGGDHN